MFESVTALLPRLMVSQPATVVHGVYNDAIQELIGAVYSFLEQHTEYVQNYAAARTVIEMNNIEWGDGESNRSMANVDVSELDGRCIMALLLGLIRADRIWGCLSSFIQRGTVQRWLERLKEIDDESTE